MPGMRSDTGFRCVWADTWQIEWAACGAHNQRRPNLKTDVPDLTDPATMGCLLALVREACQKPAVTMFWGDYWQVVYSSKVEDGCADHGHLGDGDTEAEALVAALEDAP